MSTLCVALIVSNIINARLIYWQRKLINALRADSLEAES